MNATWHHLWGAVDDDGRLDRATTPKFSVDGFTVTMTATGYTIRYVPSLTGYGTPPTEIADGIGGPSPETAGIPPTGTLYLVAVAFDPSGELLPSAPAQAEFTR